MQLFTRPVAKVYGSLSLRLFQRYTIDVTKLHFTAFRKLPGV